MDVKIIKSFINKVFSEKQNKKVIIPKYEPKDLKHMDAKELKGWVSGCDIKFKYKGFDGYIGPAGGIFISLKYDGKTYNAISVDEAMSYPLFDGKSLNEIARHLDDLEIFGIKDGRMYINAEILKEKININNINFKYKGFEGGAVYLSPEQILIWYKDDEHITKSIDEAVSYPFFDGKSLNDIIGEIEIL